MQTVYLVSRRCCPWGRCPRCTDLADGVYRRIVAVREPDRIEAEKAFRAIPDAFEPRLTALPVLS